MAFCSLSILKINIIILLNIGENFIREKGNGNSKIEVAIFLGGEKVTKHRFAILSMNFRSWISKEIKIHLFSYQFENEIK